MESSTNITRSAQNAPASASTGRDKEDPKTSIERAVESLHLGRAFTGRYLQYAPSYQPLDGEVVIASYPKCGSMWMQHILYGILSRGTADVLTMEERQRAILAIDFAIIGGARSGPQPWAMKTHLPFHLQPYSPRAKYIFITRNPYDCCVSYYHHAKSRPFYNLQEATFDMFLGMFVTGNVAFGDYFDYLLSWYKHRDDENVFFLTYEALKKDTSGAIIKIADFLNQERYGDHFKQHPQALDNVLGLSSFEKMKSGNAEYRSWSSKLQKLKEEAHIEENHRNREAVGSVMKKPMTGDRVRKGIVGDWKNHFSSQQVVQMKEYISFKTLGTDVMDLWKELDLP